RSGPSTLAREADQARWGAKRTKHVGARSGPSTLEAQPPSTLEREADQARWRRSHRARWSRSHQAQRVSDLPCHTPLLECRAWRTRTLKVLATSGLAFRAGS